MRLANQVQIERKPDHFVLKFSVASSSPEAAEEVATLAVPLTTGMELALGLFEGTIRSIVDLQGHISEMQERINALNRLAVEAQGRGK